MSAAAWVGRRHQELGVPCQDCFALERSEDARVCCAALADGAGSRTRSELGAACVTRCVSRLLCGEYDIDYPSALSDIERLLAEWKATGLIS